MKTVLIGLLALAMVAGAASAAQKNYVQPNPGVGVSLVDVHTCPGFGEPTPEEDVLTILGFEIGGVSFCPGDPAGDANGDATLSISDDFNPSVSARYCEDLNANSICGEGPVPPDGTTLEPRVNFCIDFVIDSPIDTTARADWSTSNWDPAVPILVFIDAPGNGNPAVSVCGPVYSGGTTGIVSGV